MTIWDMCKALYDRLVTNNATVNGKIAENKYNGKRKHTLPLTLTLKKGCYVLETDASYTSGSPYDLSTITDFSVSGCTVISIISDTIRIISLDTDGEITVTANCPNSDSTGYYEQMTITAYQ